MSNFIDRFGALGILTGLFGIGYGYLQMRKMKKTAEALDLSIEEMSKKIPVDIEKAVLDKAIQKAADREVRSSVQTTSQAIIKSAREDMSKKIREEVSGAYEEIKGGVHDQIHREVSEIDIDEMKSDIKQEVKDEVFKKVCDLGGIANLFTKRSYGGYGNSIDLDSAKDILDLFPSWERKEILGKLIGRD